MVEELVKKLISKNETISMMESCTGGAFANAITNIPGYSKVLNFSAITISTDYRIRLGVDREVIKEYSVISRETAREMAFKMMFFAECTYGIGITGRMNIIRKNEIEDPNQINRVYVSIYNSKNRKYTDILIRKPCINIKECKEFIIEKITERLLDVIDE